MNAYSACIIIFETVGFLTLFLGLTMVGWEMVHRMGFDWERSTDRLKVIRGGKTK